MKPTCNLKLTLSSKKGKRREGSNLKENKCKNRDSKNHSKQKIKMVSFQVDQETSVCEFSSDHSGYMAELLN